MVSLAAHAPDRRGADPDRLGALQAVAGFRHVGPSRGGARGAHGRLRDHGPWLAAAAGHRSEGGRDPRLRDRFLEKAAGTKRWRGGGVGAHRYGQARGGRGPQSESRRSEGSDCPQVWNRSARGDRARRGPGRSRPHQADRLERRSARVSDHRQSGGSAAQAGGGARQQHGWHECPGGRQSGRPLGAARHLEDESGRGSRSGHAGDA